ncbi:hypothetical protein ACO0SA_002556 [Hanseniaspora valbyensis]
MSTQQATSIPAIQTKLINPNLTYQEIRVMKDKGTEPPNSSEFLLNEKNGVKGKYFCKNCNTLLYESTDMFESGCGWPSFHTSSSSIPSENADTTVKNGDYIVGKSGKRGIKDNNIIQYTDNSMGMERTEVCCLNCDSHLGHIFKGEGWERILGEGKGNRYCINGISLNFEKEK